MTIGNKTKEKAVGLVETLFEKHLEEIDQAFSEFDSKLSVGINVGFETEKDRGVKVTAKIKFVEKEVKDQLSEVVDENQRPLEF